MLGYLVIAGFLVLLVLGLSQWLKILRTRTVVEATTA
jgi:hypothetical protein